MEGSISTTDMLIIAAICINFKLLPVKPQKAAGHAGHVQEIENKPEDELTHCVSVHKACPT